MTAAADVYKAQPCVGVALILFTCIDSFHSYFNPTR